MASRANGPSRTITIPDRLDDTAVASVREALERVPPPAGLIVDLHQVRRIDPDALRRLVLLVRAFPRTRIGVTGVTIGVAGQLLRSEDTQRC